jgi:preprotein translocase SecF subunit
MAFYILFAFAGMRALISPALLGLVTIVTMLFDVSFAAGAYGFMMNINPAIQIDTIFIIALLTVLGYSVNDTIVIFDRIRENFVDKQKALEDGRTTRAEVFELSLWQTMRRSITTSLSTLLVVGGMYVFGTGILKMFAFTMGMGVIAGTYSSIFLAAPFAFLLTHSTRKDRLGK